MIKAVIFDLDDTLYSETDYVRSGLKAVSGVLEKKYNLHGVYKKLIRLFELSKAGVFDRFLNGEGISFGADEIETLVQLYASHKPEINLYGDVFHTLQSLKNTGYKTGLITDGRVVSQNNKIDALNIRNMFDEIIITDAIGDRFRKPHPKAFEIMRDRLSVDYSEMLYVGDNPDKDFYISKIYPVKTVRIYRKECIYKSEKYYRDIKEQYSCNDLDAFLLKLNSTDF
jgi:putative hydrolase of the HAD superfamily